MTLNSDGNNCEQLITIINESIAVVKQLDCQTVQTTGLQTADSQIYYADVTDNE